MSAAGEPPRGAGTATTGTGSEPGPASHGVEQSGNEQPGNEQPGVGQSGNEQPGVEQPGVEQPGAAPADRGRAHLRALTGGLADLSDAMAAVGIESVAARPAPRVARDVRAARDAAPPPAADFRVRCPGCGPQYVAVADVRFVETGDGADANRYLFTCPECGSRVRRPAGPELADILRTSGVTTLALRRGPGQAL